MLPSSVLSIGVSLILALTALLSLNPALLAQTADLTGSVHDTSAAPIANATIDAVNVKNGFRRAVIADDTGTFRFAFLPPGEYEITVAASGFETSLEKGVFLRIGENGRVDFVLQLSRTSDSVTITERTASVGSEAGAVSTVIDRSFIDVLPLNGRTFQSLVALTPGVVLTKATFGEQGQFSVNGQRANANYFTLDGVSANIGISAGSSLVQSASGSLPGLGVTGGTNTLVSVDALEEFRVQTSSYAAEYGRMPGAQLQMLTRSGTNQFHGSLFDYFRNDRLDATDWFANANRLPKAALRQNDFGGVLGGPVIRERTFFFLSYEGLRLRQPQVEATDVPSLSARNGAPTAIQPYLNSFPVPNGPDGRYGFAPFVASFTDASSLDATSLRLDHLIGNRVVTFGRFNYAPSHGSARLYALNNPTDTSANTMTATTGITVLISPRISNEFRSNYSRTTGDSFARLDDFGGAVPITAAQFFPAFADPQNSLGGFFLNGGINASWYLGKNVTNKQQQYNVVDSLAVTAGAHQLRFGVDLRRIGNYNGPRAYDQFAYFSGAAGAESGRSTQVTIDAQDSGSVNFYNLSLFAQDAWKVNRRLTVTYGLRWELNPAPTGGSGHILYTFQNYDDPKRIQLAPPGTSFYPTRWTNFAPRLGVAYQAPDGPNRHTTVRAGFGMFYDLGSGIIGQSASGFPYYRSTTNFSGAAFPLSTEGAHPPAFSLQPAGSTIYGAVKSLNLPVTYEWNVTVDNQFGQNNSISVAYVGAAGRELLRQEYFINPNEKFTYAYLLRNTGFSDFHSLQVQYQRRLSRGVQIIASYTFAHSLDNTSTDSGSHLSAVQVNPQRDRGPSDFDIRHALSSAFTWNLPKPRRFALLFGNWSFDGVSTVRSATPVDVTYTRDLGFGAYSFRPDLVVNVPLYLQDSNVAGGRRFNPDAFVLQTAYPGQQGTLGRNALRGLPLEQINFTIRREFHLFEHFELQFRSEMFNVFNHPSFADPTGLLLSPQFGYPVSTLGRDLGRGGVNAGLNPLYQVGGPRSIQLAMKLVF